MIELSNEDLGKKIFIRYKLGEKQNEEGNKVPDNVLLEISTLEKVEEVGQIITQVHDGTLIPINTFKIKNDYLDDVFVVTNVTKTKNVVVLPMNPDFDYDKFISKFIETNINSVPKRALNFIMEQKVTSEEYEIAAVLRDELFKREGKTSDVNN